MSLPPPIVSPPATLPAFTIHPKIKAAAAAAGAFIILSLASLYATDALTLKSAILVVTGSLIPVVSGYLKSS